MGRRLFIAIEIPDALKEAIELSRPRMKGYLGVPFRWISPENLHVTMAFLGSVPEDHLPLIENSCSETATRVNAFEMTSDILGCFPNPRKARILWLGLGGDSAIRGLYTTLFDHLAPLGFKSEKRPFHPHITLARAKRIGPVDVENMNHEIELHHRVPADKITLFESILERQGARYVPLKRFELSV